ncbi:hypothetical protein EUGRSUZ_H03700 [Eucalyptus grandis]|uniref:Uncharacterized protein n=2 Tax=Eucalyptus grandis TaxID=71139 RepID=A0A059B5P8_EUCGR|nr:hypothetical protein EUGRSUZ_H03700 [Eucalyptus grandis]
MAISMGTHGLKIHDFGVALPNPAYGLDYTSLHFLPILRAGLARLSTRACELDSCTDGSCEFSIRSISSIGTHDPGLI